MGSTVITGTLADWQRDTEQGSKVCQWRHEGFAKDDYGVLTIKFSQSDEQKFKDQLKLDFSL